MHGIVRLVRARVLLVSIVALAAGCRTPEHAASAASPPMHSTAAAERAIRQIIQDETRAWNEGDAVAYSRHFATDGIFTNIRGQAFDGYDAFLRQHEVVFRGFFQNTRLQQDIVVLRFVEPGLALVETLTAVSGMTSPPTGAVFDTQGRLRTRLLQVVARRGDSWKIVAYHNVDVKRDVPVPEPGAGDR